MKNIITAFTFLIFVSCTAQAQMMNNDRTITINMSATEQVPADLINFNVIINASFETPKGAFELHREREGKLADLLSEFGIEESDIRFQPVSIYKQNRGNNNRDQFSRTEQQVSVTFSDFEIYESLQLRLIESGFDTFNATFSSTQLEQAKEDALISAIEAAKERAELISSTAGVGINRIMNINYSEHQIRSYRMADTMPMMAESSSSMMDFAQVVNVTANITITFDLTTLSD